MYAIQFIGGLVTLACLLALPIELVIAVYETFLDWRDECTRIREKRNGSHTGRVTRELLPGDQSSSL
jgi:hypothetical protein